MKNDIIRDGDSLVMGRLVAGTTENKIAEAEQVYDTVFGYNSIDKVNKTIKLVPATKTGLDQSTINWAVSQQLNSLKTAIDGIKIELPELSVIQFQNIFNLSQKDLISFLGQHATTPVIAVIKTEGTKKICVGIATIFSCEMHHQITVLFTTNYSLDSHPDFSVHTDGKPRTFYRCYGLTGIPEYSGVKVEKWTNWVDYHNDKDTYKDGYYMYNLVGVDKDENVNILSTRTSSDQNGIPACPIYVGDQLMVGGNEGVGTGKYESISSDDLNYYWRLSDELVPVGYHKTNTNFWVSNVSLYTPYITIYAKKPGIYLVEEFVGTGNDKFNSVFYINVLEKDIHITNNVANTTLNKYVERVSKVLQDGTYTVTVKTTYGYYLEKGCLSVKDTNDEDKFVQYSTVYSNDGKSCSIRIWHKGDITIEGSAKIIPESIDGNGDSYTTTRDIPVYFINVSHNPAVTEQYTNSNSMPQSQSAVIPSGTNSLIYFDELYKYANTEDIKVTKAPSSEITFDYSIIPYKDDNDVNTYRVEIWNIDGDTGEIIISASKINTADPEPDPQPVVNPQLSATPTSILIGSSDTSEKSISVSSNINWSFDLV